MGDVIVLSGPPGAGKSTVAEQLADLLDPSALVRGDDFFAFLKTGAIRPWLPHAHIQNTAVVEAAAAATGRLAGYCNVVYDGVVGPWFLDTFQSAAQLKHLNYVVLLPPLEVCLARVSGRHDHGFKDLDAATHMWHRFQRAHIDPRHVLNDPDLHPIHIARTLVGQLAVGTLRYP